MRFKSFYSRMAVLFVFAVAMAYLEAAVVVYLHQIFGSELFSVVKNGTHRQLVLVEIGREAATVVMLASVAMVAGRKFYSRFAVFLFLFGVWDIFYYIWLFVLLGWPPSLLTWDVLFLIPLVWTGPVVAPVIVSLSMILSAWLVLWRLECHRAVHFSWLEWLGFIAASLVLVVAFVWNHTESLTQTETRLRFPWAIFLAGEMLALILFSRSLWFAKKSP